MWVAPGIKPTTLVLQTPYSLSELYKTTTMQEPNTTKLQVSFCDHVRSRRKRLREPGRTGDIAIYPTLRCSRSGLSRLTT